MPNDRSPLKLKVRVGCKGMLIGGAGSLEHSMDRD